MIVNGEEHVFVNGIGYGLDGYCCEVGDEIQRHSDKKVNYSAIAIKGILGKFKPRRATVTVDGVTRTYKKAWLPDDERQMLRRRSVHHAESGSSR